MYTQEQMDEVMEQQRRHKAEMARITQDMHNTVIVMLGTAKTRIAQGHPQNAVQLIDSIIAALAHP